ncbi:MAG: glutaminase [Prochlorothrix sp.]|nr:glutaminase [Prochlorothrix sp.]
MITLQTLHPQTLAAAFDKAQSRSTLGHVADRIPYLGQQNPQTFGAIVIDSTGVQWNRGRTEGPIALMSVMKPFLLLYLLEIEGAAVVGRWVDYRASALPFNSVTQLQADGGRPRNPMINSGAMTLADKVPGKTGADRCAAFCQWLNQRAGTQYRLNQALLDSVHQVGREPNLALLEVLTAAGNLDQPSVAIDTYEQVCCLSSSLEDLAKLGRLLALPHPALKPTNQDQVNQVLRTCGLYEASSMWTRRIGLPMKSGISGALVMVMPGEGAIACYGPALDDRGNSIAALTFLELLAQAGRSAWGA